MKNQKLKTRFLIIVGFFLLTTNLFAQDPNFYIYLCFGQSNMQGQGPIQVQDKTVNSRFKTYQAMNCTNLNRKKETWYTAVPPTCQCFSLLSPADYFGRTTSVGFSNGAADRYYLDDRKLRSLSPCCRKTPDLHHQGRQL